MSDKEITAPKDLEGRRVLLGVSSSIAEHRALDLASALIKRGAAVQVVMTPESTRLIQPLAFEAITHRRAVASLWDRPESYEMDHLEFTKWAEVFVVMPATANVIAKLAQGIADDALTTTALAWEGPLLLAPAMNPAMWRHPALQKNLATLRDRGALCVGPAAGPTACGDIGLGRLAPVAEILDAVIKLLKSSGVQRAASAYASPLAGQTVLITSGPTREFLDPVRYLSNPSSGKMGHALAAEAVRRGARVLLVHGPVTLPSPPGCAEVVPVVSAHEMSQAVVARAPKADILIFAAAVSDWQPARRLDLKEKKHEVPATESSVRLVRTPDIARAAFSVQAPGALRIGFAAETHNLLGYAQEKMKDKHFDLVVANDVSTADSGFASDNNQAVLLLPGQPPRALDPMPKTRLASIVCDEIEALLEARTP